MDTTFQQSKWALKILKQSSLVSLSLQCWDVQNSTQMYKYPELWHLCLSHSSLHIFSYSLFTKPTCGPWSRSITGFLQETSCLWFVLLSRQCPAFASVVHTPPFSRWEKSTGKHSSAKHLPFSLNCPRISLGFQPWFFRFLFILIKIYWESI